MRDMFRTAVDAAYSLLGFGDPEENNREEENPEGNNPEEENPQTIKRQYLGEGVTPQSVDTFEEIWTSSTDDEITLQRYREYLQDTPSPFIWLPVRRTQQGEASTIMHEMILGSHDQFRHFIQLFLDNDARRFHLFYTFIYGGLNLNGDHEAELAANRPIELAINEMLNIENPAEERAEIRSNLGYLLAHFIRDNPVSLANNQGLLIILQRFINGDDDQFPVSEEARDRCLYHISSIWADIHQQDPGNNGNIDGYRYEGQDRDFLTILRVSQEADQREVLQYLLPDGYEIPEGRFVIVPEVILGWVCRDIEAGNGIRHLLEYEAVRKCAPLLAYSKALLYAAEFGHTEDVRILLDLDSVKANAHQLQNQALRGAVRTGHTDAVRMLLEVHDVRKYAHLVIDPELIHAVARGHTEIVEMLIDIDSVKANAHERDNAALRAAAYHGHTEIVEMLLKCDKVRKNLHERGNWVLEAAVDGGRKEIVEILLQYDDIREYAFEVWNPVVLRRAIESRDTDMIRLLLNIDNVKVNAHNTFWRCLLHPDNGILKEAAELGSTEIVDLLLEISSVRNAPDGQRIYQDRLDAGANIPLDGAPRPAEELAGHAQGIAEPHRQTGEDGNDREHNIRQDSSL